LVKQKEKTKGLQQIFDTAIASSPFAVTVIVSDINMGHVTEN
jgi:hypothetical protein